jgi:DNA-binding HxlR family transcriptional regulator
MPSYNEYCPISVGVEFFGDRWTPLVIREMLFGSRRFNEIHRGLGRMSRSLLSQRLRELERRGIIERRVDPGGTIEYVLTPAGEELQPIIWSLGHWAARWSFGDPADEMLDAGWLAWRLHQSTLPSKMPATRTVVHFILDGVGAGEAWLVLDRGASTACRIDPGYDVDLVVLGDNRALTCWMFGRLTFSEILRNGDVRLVGPSRLARAFPTWFETSKFARSIGRRAATPSPTRVAEAV